MLPENSANNHIYHQGINSANSSFLEKAQVSPKSSFNRPAIRLLFTQVTDYEVLPTQKVRLVDIKLAKHTCGKNRAMTTEGTARKNKKIKQSLENC